MWATSEFQLSESGLEIFEDLGRADVGVGRLALSLSDSSFSQEDVEVSGRHGDLYGGRHRDFECV